MQGGFVDHLAGAYFLGKRFGKGDNAVQMLVGVPLAEHLGAQYLVGRVNLAILNVALVARREDEHLAVVENLAQVVIDVARLVKVVGNDEVGALHAWQSGKEHGSSRTRQTIDDNLLVALACQQTAHGVDAGLQVKYVAKLRKIHLL